MSIRYYCTNCAHAFESEQTEALVCPKCFWTSSVVREDSHQETREQSVSREPGKAAVVGHGFLIALGALKPLFVCALIAALAAGGYWIYKNGGLDRVRSWMPVKEQGPRSEASSSKPALDSKKSAAQPADTASEPAALSAADNAVLARKIELDPQRELSSMEYEILGRRAALRTGLVEKLPGPVWSLERFKKMLEEQQNTYQVPLPRSYRDKLSDLFEAHYVTGGQLFTEGRLLEARNSWVESLAFPVYANDIEKHRGVVLTMLRPFINDTLSKIGAINGMLVEGPVRELETRLNDAYGKFFDLLEQKKWDAAYEAAEGLLNMTREFDKIAVQTPKVPPYPPQAKIDRDIGKALFDLLEASRPAVADVSALERDVRMKKQVVETLLPARFEESLEAYRSGFTAMDRGDWEAAADFFNKVEAPAILKRDSEEKVRILQKLAQSVLDSSAVSG